MAFDSITFFVSEYWDVSLMPSPSSLQLLKTEMKWNAECLFSYYQLLVLAVADRAGGREKIDLLSVIWSISGDYFQLVNLIILW